MFKSILIPLDGSELAECALPYVESIIAGGNVQKVFILRVVEPIHFPVGTASDDGGIFTGDDAREAERQAVAAAQDAAKIYLNQLMNRFTFNGVTLHTDVVSGEIADSVAEYAEERNIDLIAIATHGTPADLHRAPPCPRRCDVTAVSRSGTRSAHHRA